MEESIARKTVQKEGFFPSDGRWLFYRCWHTHPKKGEVLAIHGASEHSERYQALGHYFARQGYDFYVFDLTGHGRSEGRRGHIGYFEEYLVDIANFYGFLRIYRKMGTPFLLGHSMGGLLAALFAAWGPCPAKGMLLSAPLFQLAIPISFWEKYAIKLLAFFYPGFCLANKIDPAYLTHDKAIVEEYMSDPLVDRYLTCRWVNEMSKAIKLVASTASHIKIPCMIFHGSDDKITDVEGSKRFFQGLSGKDKQLYIVPGGYHEILNEMDREKVFALTMKWLDSRR